MNFDLTEERQMLQDSLRRFLRDRYDTATRNKILESDSGMSSDIWAGLAELGVIGALFTELWRAKLLFKRALPQIRLNDL